MDQNTYKDLMTTGNLESLVIGIGKITMETGKAIDHCVQQSTMAMDLATQLESIVQKRSDDGEEILQLEEIIKLTQQMNVIVSNLQSLSGRCDQGWLTSREIKKVFWR